MAADHDLAIEIYANSRRPVASSRGDRFGGTEGNQILTSSVAAILTALLIAEGVTILQMGGLLSVHMFIGLVWYRRSC